MNPRVVRRCAAPTALVARPHAASESTGRPSGARMVVAVTRCACDRRYINVKLTERGDDKICRAASSCIIRVLPHPWGQGHRGPAPPCSGAAGVAQLIGGAVDVGSAGGECLAY